MVDGRWSVNPEIQIDIIENSAWEAPGVLVQRKKARNLKKEVGSEWFT